MTIMQGVQLCPPLEDDDNNQDGNFMSPELQARFERLKRSRSSSGNNESSIADKDADHASSRRKLATETAVMAEAEIARMRDAIEELQELIDLREGRGVVAAAAVGESSVAIARVEDEFNVLRDHSSNASRSSNLNEQQPVREAAPAEPGYPVAMISFPRLPQVINNGDEPGAGGSYSGDEAEDDVPATHESTTEQSMVQVASAGKD